MAVKNVADLQPGDIINLGLGGPQMIVATRETGNGLAIICDCGEKRLLPYDCTIYVYYNADEQREMRRSQLLAEQNAERKRIEQQALARARRDRQLLQRASEPTALWDSW